MIIAIRTDNPVTELYLLDSSVEILDRDIWESGNSLSGQLLARLEGLLSDNSINWSDISAVVAYQGPGSFTGLRIGLTVANSVASAQGIPVAGASGDDWIIEGMEQLKTREPGDQILPEYGGEANITRPKK